MPFNVYKVNPLPDYTGHSLVAASNPDEANQIITDYIKSKDVTEVIDAYGYGHVDKSDKVDGMSSPDKGFIHHGIKWRGL